MSSKEDSEAAVTLNCNIMVIVVTIPDDDYHPRHFFDLLKPDLSLRRSKVARSGMFAGGGRRP